MSWRDRAYSGDSYEPDLGVRFRRPSSMVTWLIIANVAVMFIDAIVGRSFPLHTIFGLSLEGIHSFYFWQPVTYMFIHGGVWHLLFNMLGLYVFGSEFERHFGSRRFLQFYGTCGIVGGMAYLGLSLLKPEYSFVPLIGASGAVFGLLIAAVIFFPFIQVVLFIFPMPVRVFALIMLAMFLLEAFTDGQVANLGGQICHLAGAATGVGMFYAWGMMPRIRLGSRGRRRRGAWARRQQRLADEQAQVDRILEKVHHHGLQSLSWRERRTLSRATQHQRERDRQLDRVDNL